jgi:hypothetical protein
MGAPGCAKNHPQTEPSHDIRIVKVGHDLANRPLVSNRALAQFARRHALDQPLKFLWRSGLNCVRLPLPDPSLPRCHARCRIPSFELDNLPVEGAQDRDAWVGLPFGLIDEERGKRCANDPKQTMFHDLSSGERDGYNLKFFIASQQLDRHIVSFSW